MTPRKTTPAALRPETEYKLNEQAYHWYMGLLRKIIERVSLNIKVHGDKSLLREADVVLFNHFVHLETALPLFMMYEEGGVFCRSVAHRELFDADPRFAKFLSDMGAIPHDHPRLFPMLVANVLRGHKMIIFPEGRLVKDRRSVDENGNLGVFSSRDNTFRPLHRGGAALAVTLDMLKTRLRQLDAGGNTAEFERWARQLDITPDRLRESIARPTKLLPATITYYPIRTIDNFVSRLTKLVARGTPQKVVNEMILQGNMLLHHTDMDILFGEPIVVQRETPVWQKFALEQGLGGINSIEELFALKDTPRGWGQKVLSQLAASAIDHIRDIYTERLYGGVLVNQSHLAARLLLTLLGQGRKKVEKGFFHRALYLAIKGAQHARGMHLHRSLTEPGRYRGVLEGDNENMQVFLESARKAKLLDWDATHYLLSDKLAETPDFYKDRLAHPVLLYANEAAPLPGLREVADHALEEAAHIGGKALARKLFDDELRSYQWRRNYFDKPRFKDINDQEASHKGGEPYLLNPLMSNGTAVVLVHGFRASPAQLRTFGEKLRLQGYTVVGVRLAGHGTSPWDLHHRSWNEWVGSVRRGYRVASGLAERVVLVGFSTGAALSLYVAAEKPPKLAAVVSVAAPLALQDKNINLVPWVSRLNRLVSTVTGNNGVVPFYASEPTDPDVSYRNMPVQAVQELIDLMGQLKNKLPGVRVPVLVLQGDRDPVVNPASALEIFERLGTPDKMIQMIASDRHDILRENVGATHRLVFDFIKTRSGHDS